MTQEKKQTAVEFYAEQDTMLNIAFFKEKDKISHLAFFKAKRELLDKAIAMEREQIEEAFKHGNLPTFMGELLTADNYYERTYGKEAGHE